MRARSRKLMALICAISLGSSISAGEIAEPSATTEAPASDQFESDPEYAKNLALMRETKEVVAQCYATGLRTVADVSACSGYLVPPSELEGCLSADANALCLATATCASNEPPGQPCAGGPINPDLMYPSVPTGVDPGLQEPRLPTGEQLKAMDFCQKTIAADQVRLSNCLADSVLSQRENAMRLCATNNALDPLNVALNCIDAKFAALQISDADKSVLRCAMKTRSRDEASECTSMLPSPPTLLQKRVQCVIGAPPSLEMVSCLLMVSEAPAAAQQADCVRQNEQAVDKVAAAKECLAAQKLDGKALQEADLALTAADHCVADFKATGAEGLIRCSPEIKEPGKVIAAIKPDLDCLEGKAGASVLDCASPEFSAFRACFDGYASTSDRALNCGGIVRTASQDVRVAVKCAANIAGGPKDAIDGFLAQCRGELSTYSASLAQFNSCALVFEKSKAQGIGAPAQDTFSGCLLNGANVGAVATCLITAGSSDLADFLGDCRSVLGSNFLPGADRALKLYGCYVNYPDSQGAAALCAFAPSAVVEKIAVVLQCAGSNSEQAMLWCFVTPLLKGPAKSAAAVGTCVAQSSSPSAGELCAAKVLFPKVFEKIPPTLQIATECAVTATTGPGYAGCVGTRLLVAELMKCLKGGVGKGCFGPNNEIVKFYSNFYKSITHPRIGKGNEIRKGLRAWDKAVDQPIGSAISDLAKHPIEIFTFGIPVKTNSIVKSVRRCFGWC